MKVPLTYPIARQDHRFGDFVNTWIELKRKDGTLEEQYVVSRCTARHCVPPVGGL